MGAHVLPTTGRRVLVLAIAAALLTTTPAALADTTPPTTTPATPATVSTDVLPTPQIDGVVWSQVIAGNTVFVGGEFTTARPAGAAPGTSTVARSNFLAYDLTTGALLPFAPSFDTQVRTLALSPDGKTLYVAGQFTKVGTATRYRFAAFDVASGTLTTLAPTFNSSVYGLAVTDTTVYAAGIFTSVNNTARTNAAAVDRTTGALKSFAVSPAGGTIKQVAVQPGGSKVILAGSFTSMGGNRSAYGLAMVGTAGGTPTTMPVNSVVRDAGANSKIMSLAATSEGFYGTGYAFGQDDGNLEGTFKADWNGALTWLEDCHGDTYSVAPTASVVYVAGHPHDCARIGGFPDTTNPVVYHRALAFTTAKTRTLTRETGIYYDFGGLPAPTLLHWFPDFKEGTYTGQIQGPWNVAANSDYVVYGGEFTKVNGKAQQGLVRFARTGLAPNLDGPQLSGTSMGFTASASTGKVTLSLPADYDRDNNQLTYRFSRGSTVLGEKKVNSSFWSRPTVSWVDTGVTPGASYSYSVKAIDPLGNVKTSATVTLTAR